MQNARVIVLSERRPSPGGSPSRRGGGPRGRVGLDAGPELQVGDRVTITPQFAFRLPLTTEGSVNSKLLQVVVSWRGGS